MSLKKKGLGKGFNDLGLSELLSSIQDIPVEGSDKETQLRMLKIDLLKPGKYQPRKNFNEEHLQELADSIRTQGVIQPIVVRGFQNNEFEIVAGERRWRAAKMAGLVEIPAVVREIQDDAAIAVGLIENIQRQNLNAIEEAQALQRLGDEFQLTHQQIAEVVGRSRTAITNLLRLLSLHPDVKRLLESNQVEMGHARALLAVQLPEQPKIAEIILDKKLSVRETEDYIRSLQKTGIKKSVKPNRNEKVLELEKNLTKRMGTKVSIKQQENGKGKIVVHFRNSDHLKKLISAI